MFLTTLLFTVGRILNKIGLILVVNAGNGIFSRFTASLYE